MPLAFFVVAALGATGCARDDVTARASPPGHVLRWYDSAAPDWPLAVHPPVMHADAAGGTWLAIPFIEGQGGRLYYLAPGSAWKKVADMPPMSEVTLGSARGGSVYLGFNRMHERFAPTLLHVEASGASYALPTPDERIDATTRLQVGAYAMRSDTEGWACGARGRVWRMEGGRWSAVRPAFRWSEGDRENTAYCSSITFDDAGASWMTSLDGEIARWDGGGWAVVPETGAGRVTPTTPPVVGLGVRGQSVVRLEGDAWRTIASTPPLGGAVFDPTGRWVSLGDRLIALDGASPTRFFGPRAIAGAALATQGEAFLLAWAKGVLRSTTRDVPTYRDVQAAAVPFPLRWATAADIDDDGDDDLVGVLDATYPAGGEVQVLLNDGSGHFVPAGGALPTAVNGSTDALQVADMDGDGRLDLVVSVQQSGIEVWRGVGDGRFERTSAVQADRAPPLVLADIDGDGDIDVCGLPVLRSLLFNDGVGHLTAGPTPALPPGTEQVTLIDADDDGDLDLVAHRWRDPAVLLLNDADGFHAVPLPLVAEGAAVADLDRDGRPELYAQIVHDRGELPPFTRCTLSRDGCAPETTTIPSGVLVDLNLDGTLDVITENLRGGEAAAGVGVPYLATPAAGQPFEELTPITGSLLRGAPLDADGDGARDIYTTRGLALSAEPAPRYVRVRLRASGSNTHARGARVLLRSASTGRAVASEASTTGTLLMGVPDAADTYDVEVRFAGGPTRVVHGVRAQSDVVVHDEAGGAWLWRRVAWWARAATLRAVWPREVAGALAVLALGVLAVWRVPRLRRHAGALGVAFVAAYVALFGFAVRTEGAWPVLLAPSALALAAVPTFGRAAIMAARSARRIGPYMLLEKLGAGAAGTVWRAKGKSRQVALKLFSAESMQMSDARDRFFREAHAGSNVVDEHVVRILGAERLEDGRAYLAMQLVEGVSLARMLASGAIAPERARALARDVARGLKALHAAGIVHRDVKPGNIMVTDAGRAVLTDLGLVRSAMFRTVTRHEVAVGTLAYMSPEQCTGIDVDARADIWSLGVVLYEMLAGARPFDAMHELELVYRIHNAKAAPLAGDVPSDLAEVVARCLERDRDKRFETTEDLWRALGGGSAA